MSASRPKEENDRSRVDGFEIEIFKLVKDEATSEQWKQWLRTPLEHAASKGNFDLFTRLIDAGACRESGRQGWGRCDRTLLGAAACGNKCDVMVQALLEAGEKDDINTRFGAKRESALHVTAARGAEDASKALVMAGADPNLGNFDGDSPLHLAAEEGHHRILGSILLRKEADVDVRNLFLETPLHLAAAMGRTLCISELLMGGADKDDGDSKGETPLFKAAANNHLGAVKELLAAGADHGITTMHYCPPLQVAASRGHTTILKAFLDKGSREIDATDSRGWTALHHAATPVRDNGDVVRALLEAGADVNAKADADETFTPLHVAVNRRIASICTIRALLEGGADVHMRDECNQTPFHVACMRLNVSVAQLLLRWGADEMLKDNRGDTPADLIGVLVDDDLTNEDLTDEEFEIDHQRIRRMLARAPADRSWRRRGWLVLSRSCPTRVHIANRGSNRGSSDNSNSCCVKVARVSGEDSGGDDEETEGKTVPDFNDLVARLVGLEVDGLFRLVVGFL